MPSSKPTPARRIPGTEEWTLRSADAFAAALEFLGQDGRATRLLESRPACCAGAAEPCGQCAGIRGLAEAVLASSPQVVARPRRRRVA